MRLFFSCLCFGNVVKSEHDDCIFKKEEQRQDKCTGCRGGTRNHLTFVHVDSIIFLNVFPTKLSSSQFNKSVNLETIQESRKRNKATRLKRSKVKEKLSRCEKRKSSRICPAANRMIDFPKLMIFNRVMNYYKNNELCK